jgi:hypothetical protein
MALVSASELSRSVAVLRTSVVDSGLCLKILELFKRETEDCRVVGAAVRAVCNIVCEFSHLRPVRHFHFSVFLLSSFSQIYLDQGLMPRLVQLISFTGCQAAIRSSIGAQVRRGTTMRSRIRSSRKLLIIT